MTSQPPDDDLTAATNRLASKVGLLGDRIAFAEETTARLDETVTELQDTNRRLDDTVQRQSRWIKVLAAVAALLLAGGVWLYDVAQKADDAAAQANHSIEENKANAVKSCENANQSRLGSILLWQTLLNAPRDPAAPPQSEQQKQLISDFLEFIGELYKQRDCTDLSRDYPLPDVPDSLKGR